ARAPWSHQQRQRPDRSDRPGPRSAREARRCGPRRADRPVRALGASRRGRPGARPAATRGLPGCGPPRGGLGKCHDERQPLNALDANTLSDVRTFVAARSPKLPMDPDLSDRAARGEDLGLLPDHRLRPRLGLPAPCQSQAPDNLSDLDDDAAEDHEQAPRPRYEEKRENECDREGHAVSVARMAPYDALELEII